MKLGICLLKLRAKVLRVIQEGQIERVGGLYPIKVDVRFVAATNKDLSVMVKSEKFREDLYFRLNVFSIYLPPLRERRDDIHLLVDKFLSKLDKRVSMSDESMRLMTAYDWPGNVRELKNAVESATVLAGEMIEPTHLPAVIHKNGHAERNGKLSKSGETNGPEDPFEHRIQIFGMWEKLDIPKEGDIDQRLQKLEKELIVEALKKAGGVQVNAAKILGIKERSLWHRIKKYKIDISEYKKNA